jgi:hypothetical protein
VGFHIKKSTGWTTVNGFYVKKSSGWVSVTKAFVKKAVGWVQFWPSSGPSTTTAPYFSTDSAGNNRIIEPIIYGTSFYGQRGIWDANGGTISSYTYKLDSVTSATIGQGTIDNIIPETSMGSTSISITANSSAYDGKWMLFTVKATRSDSVSGTDSTDNTETGTGYRIPVIKNKPTLAVNTTLLINGVPTITGKPQPGDAVSLIATWDTTENKSIDATRTVTKWYRSATFPTINTTSPKAASGGYYETTGATFLGTGIAYAVTSADNDSYIFANQEVFNSFTDYTYGITEGNGIKTGDAFTQTVGAPYNFAMGNTIYHSTNGSVAFDSGFSGTGLPTSGRHLFVYGLDFVNVSTKHWSNNKDYVIQYTGGQVFNHSVPQFQITYQVKFSTDHPTYALVKIINKGSSVPQPNYIGYYEGSTQISTVAGPYVLNTGSTYKINFNGTPGTTSAVSFAGINNEAFLTDSFASQDNVFYTLVTGTFQYSLPTISFNAATIAPTSLSYTVASTGNDFASYDYIVRTGSHTGTVVSSGTNQTGTLSLTGLSESTIYYIQVDPYNSQNQNGTRMLFTETTTAAPTISNISVSNTTLFPGSATGISTNSASNVGTTNWTNGSNTSFANLSLVTGSGTLAQQADPTSLATSGTFNITSTGNANITIRAINANKTVHATWTQTNAQSHRISYDISGVPGNPQTYNGNSSASNPSALLLASAGTVTLRSITVYPDINQGGTGVTLTSTSSATAANTTTNTTATNAVTYALLPGYTPTISAATSTTDGFTGQVTNYSASYTWSISTSAGSVSFTGSPNIPNATYNFTVTGLNPGQSATVTITTTRVGYNNGSATRTGNATLGSALTPTFGTNTRTSDGFSGSVTNYNSSYTWNITVSGGASVSWGTVSGSTYPFTVTGGTAGTSYTVTVTTTRTGYSNGSGTTSASALSNLTTNPAYGTATSGSLSFTASITTSPNPTGGTYSVVSQTNGTASVNSSTGALSVTGLTLGQSSTVTVRYSLSGYNSVDITSTGSASSDVAPSGGTVSIALTSGTSGRVGATYTATVTNASGTPTPTFTRQWRRTINYSPFTISNVGTGTETYTSTYDDVDSEITCRVTFTNAVSPDQVTTSNGLSVSPPTITGITATTTNNTTPYCTWTIIGYNIQSSTGAVFYGTGTNPTTLSGTNPQANTGLTRATTSRTGTGANYYRYDNIRAFSGTGGTGRPSPSVSAIASTTVVRANAAQTTTVYGTV